jgi:F-type H+-transporting ATPase subunit a
MNRIQQSFAAGFGLLLAASSASAAVSPKPYTIFENSAIPITNSMMMSWVISALVIIGVRLAVGKPQLIPSRGQAVVESGLQGIKDMIEPIVGAKMVRPTLPLLLGLFFFILFHNWSGLLPGVGAFGFYEGHGDEMHLTYWARPANADLNMTIALGLVAAVAAWFYFVMRYAGPKTLLLDLFGNKSNKDEVGTGIWLLLFPIFIGVGLIEIVSIIFRPVSLAFRLYGNVFGGENLLVNMTGLAGFAVPIPFYFLETLIGLVQALVFTLLTAVYIGLICNHGDGEHH